MELNLFILLLGFLGVTAITPGPNNMLLTSSGANFGFWRSGGLIAGIMLGMQSILLLVAFGVGSLFLIYPSVRLLLKIVGSFYLLWLAWKIATAAYQQLETRASAPEPIRLYQAWLLQFLNPKSWLVGLGAVASFSQAGSNYHHSIAIISLAMLLINFVVGMLWLSFGNMIGRVLVNTRAWFIFNVLMGLLTAVCVILIWF